MKFFLLDKQRETRKNFVEERESPERNILAMIFNLNQIVKDKIIKVDIQKIFKNTSIYIILILLALIFLVFFTIEIKPEDPIKTTIAIWAIGLLFLFYRINRLLVLCFVIFTIPLPIHIKLMNRDAFTITTMLIITLFFINLIKKEISFTSCGKIALLFLTLFFVANTASLFNLRGEELIVNLRHYLGFLSSVMLFFIIVSNVKTIKEYELILIVIGIALIIQVFVCITMALNPDFAIPEIFRTRTGELLTTSTRPGGIVDDYELLAEWFAIFIPFAFWFLWNSKTKAYGTILIILLLVGITVTKTRGAFVSLILGLIPLFLLFPSKSVISKIRYAAVFIVVLFTGWIIISMLFKDFYLEILDRFVYAYAQYQEGSTFTAVINRQQIWEAFFHRFLQYSFLGTGRPTPTYSIGSLHSLYLTLIFQTGFLGLFSFIGFMISIVILLLVKYFEQHTSYTKRMLISVSLSALAIFLIDEFKIEYLRTAYFSQYAWLIFGLVLLSQKLYFTINSSNNSILNKR
ncbi:MAG: O-antigen ligase family protein [candidate division WOR-3 bacterium]|nr:O-antigen ligase family protein [candidate division WOR-3 bacterium]